MIRNQGSLWKGERCEYCDGVIKAKKTDLTRKRNGKYIVIEKVPTGVCNNCGIRYYAATVLKEVEEILRGHRKANANCVSLFIR